MKVEVKPIVVTATATIELDQEDIKQLVTAVNTLKAVGVLHLAKSGPGSHKRAKIVALIESLGEQLGV